MGFVFKYVLVDSVFCFLIDVCVVSVLILFWVLMFGFGLLFSFLVDYWFVCKLCLLACFVCCDLFSCFGFDLFDDVCFG